jgi:flagellar basal-body rod protein FlgF
VAGPGHATRYLALEMAAGSDFAPGRMETTGRNLDVGIRGDGFIAVQTPNGEEAYTRAGNFQLDAEGRLIVNGNPVLGEGGPLVIPEFRDLSIGEDGTITVVPPDGNATLEVGRIKLVKPDVAQLGKGDDGLFRLAGGGAAAADDGVLLASGHLEGANVNAVDAMVDTMALSRTFEMQIRMMKTADELSAAGSRLVRGG